MAYPIMIAGAIGIFLLVRSTGSTLVAPAPAVVAAAGDPAANAEVLLHVLLALVVVIIAARACGALCKRIHQPPVIGEVIAGILLGPSLLGHISPAAFSYLLPATVAPFLSIIAQIGVILFMFLVGLELDTAQLKHRTHATVAISHASIVAPFVLGAVLALWLYPKLSTRDVRFTVFALFLGVSLSVTAFPVLARILTDRGIQKTRMGTVSLTCAAVDDVTAWCLLAFLIAVAKANVSAAAVTVALTGLYVAFMMLVARPLIIRAVRAQELRESVSQSAIAVVVVALLLSTLATEAAGIHAIFGAFLLGAIIPHDSRLARDLTNKIEDLVVVLFLPAFFAFTGMRTQIGLVHGASQWLLCGVIIAAASIGKFGGTFVAARFTGFGSRDAAALGVLMNTRGLMELIVLNIGLDLLILSPTLFAMLVLMAIITTLATTPILQLLTHNATEPDGEPAMV
ncbi:MAG TPA: cation:proton antiporter [Thermoanaerobaculia bacterium]|nr:cation:proton antiporter [Thermoanaerobaculia bacterium]